MTGLPLKINVQNRSYVFPGGALCPIGLDGNPSKARLRSSVLPAYRQPAPPSIASSAMIAAPFVREPRGRLKLTPQSCKLPVEAVEHRLPRRSHNSQRFPLAGLLAPPPRRGHCGRVRHQAWLECCLFIQTWIPPNTRLPLVWFQIARSGAFYLHFHIRPRVQNLTNMRPKRPWARRCAFVIVIVGRIGEAVARRIGAGGEAQ